MNMLNLPKKVYFKDGSMNVALRELSEVYHLKRAFLVSDPGLYRSGIVMSIDCWLRDRGIRTAEFFSIGSTPSFADVRSALPKLLEFEPDVIVGIGGGAAMSAAKAMWALYEEPSLDLAEAVEHPDRIRTGAKAKLLVATSFSSGAQNSPFAVLKDDAGNTCVMNSSQLLLEAVGLVLNNLRAAESGCPTAREKLHNAAALAGAAYGNTLDTIDSEAPLYPTDTEKPANGERTGQLARGLGLEGVQSLWNACEALR